MADKQNFQLRNRRRLTELLQAQADSHPCSMIDHAEHRHGDHLAKPHIGQIDAQDQIVRRMLVFGIANSYFSTNS